MVTFILFLLGFVLLLVGAELLVRSASRIAQSAGITPLVVGLTVVAYGTSAPEAAVCLNAVYAEPPQPDISIGNVVGSNIANVLLVLGISAVVSPLVVSREIVRKGAPLVVAVSLVMYLMAWDGLIGRMEGILLFAGSLLYTMLAIHNGRRMAAVDKDSDEPKPSRSTVIRELSVQMAILIVGLVLLVIGANWLVDGAIAVARVFNVSELIVGLTIVAIGTSLPEIATSVVATWRQQRDIAVGNVVGSNLFNILLVIGICATAAPSGIAVSPTALRCDLPIMIGVTMLCLPVFYTEFTISRGEGLLFLGLFAAFTLFRVLKDTGSPAAQWFGNAMLFVVIPLTIIGLIVRCVQFQRRSRVADLEPTS